MGIDDEGVYLFDAKFQARILRCCFSGRALQRIQPLGEDSACWKETIEDENEPNHNIRFQKYFDRIQSVFMPRSVKHRR